MLAVCPGRIVCAGGGGKRMGDLERLLKRNQVVFTDTWRHIAFWSATVRPVWCVADRGERIKILDRCIGKPVVRPAKGVEGLELVRRARFAVADAHRGFAKDFAKFQNPILRRSWGKGRPASRSNMTGRLLPCSTKKDPCRGSKGARARRDILALVIDKKKGLIRSRPLCCQ